MSNHAYFPAYVDVSARSVLLVGGTEEATRKARLLINAGASIHLVASEVTEELAKRIEEGRIRHSKRPFLNSDLYGVALVIAATGVDAWDETVAHAANQAGKLVNVVDRQDLCTFIVPSIVDRSPVLIAISSFGTAPILARRIREKLEAELPRNLGKLADFAARFRSAVKSVVPPKLRRAFWEDVLDGDIAERVLGGDEKGASEQMLIALNQELQVNVKGSVSLVGAGPGASDLLTVRALQAIQTADVIVHDRLVSDEILDLCRRDADRIPVGKAKGAHSVEQSEINRLLVEHAGAGKRVVRLKGGDPFIFGRGGEEQAVLTKAGIDVQVIPGITAAVATGAATGIPLTHRGVSQKVTFVTGHPGVEQSPVAWRELARDGGTLAIYMGKTLAPAIAEELIEGGLHPTTPVVIAENASLPSQRVLTGSVKDLALLPQINGLNGPSLLIVGDVVNECTVETESIGRAVHTQEPLAIPA